VAQSPHRRRGLWYIISQNPLWATVIGGLIVAGIVGLVHLLFESSSPIPSHPSSSSAGPPLSTGGRSSTTSSPGTGYTLLWQQKSIQVSTNRDPAVTFQQNGPSNSGYPGDLYYDAPGNTGWYVWSGSLNIWLHGGTPSPAACSSDTGHPADNTFTQVGDRYCYVNNGPPNGPIVVAMVVTGISSSYVTFDATAWTPNS
jgi:hypothetical protein